MLHLIRDPVHRTIPFSSDEREIINNPLFQRLRRIRQTAFLNLVFPGATHDRFSHSLGAMHLAGVLFDHAADEFNHTYGPRALLPDQRDYFRRLVRLSALLHDSGHGPFSHSLEGLTHAGRSIHPSRKSFIEDGPVPRHWWKEKGEPNQPAWLERPTMHEEFSIGIVAMLADKNGRIGGVQAQDVASLIYDHIVPTPEFVEIDRVGPSGKWSLRSALKAIVSSEIDCDRMDYLLRDSHYTGVPYGQYDKEMLLENLIWRPSPNKPKELVVALRKKALRAFEDFLISRYHMFLQLYSHKTVVGFDIVLENALAELPEFSIHPSLEEYVTWSDEWLLKRILENRASQWGRYIRDRLALKHVLTAGPDDVKTFEKFIRPFEISPHSTAWFPALANKLDEKARDKHKDVPKMWWRNCVSYLTKESVGSLYLDDGRKLQPVEGASLLLRSNYVRRFEMVHLYCVRGEEERCRQWLWSQNVPESILSKRDEL